MSANRLSVAPALLALAGSSQSATRPVDLVLSRAHRSKKRRAAAKAARAARKRSRR